MNEQDMLDFVIQYGVDAAIKLFHPDLTDLIPLTTEDFV